MGARAFAAKVLRPEPMTLEAWGELDEPGELVDGVLVEEEVPSNLHDLIVAWLIRVLGNWAETRHGWVFGPEHKVAVAEGRGRKPDVSVYLGASRPNARASLSRVAPAIIVEVISLRARDVRRDRVDKLQEYARFGVQSYWLVDPEARVFEVLNLGPDSQYTIARLVVEGRIDIPGFDGLSIDVSELWSRVDAFVGDDEDPAAESSKV